MADQSSSSAIPKPKVFKTRAGIVRKTKAEREEYAKQEAERASARATAAENANAATISSAQLRQTERRTRDNKQKDSQVAQPRGSGVFGAGSGSRPASLRRRQDGGRSEILEGQEGNLPKDNVKKSAVNNQGEITSGANTKSTIGSSKRGAEPSSHMYADGVSNDDEEEVDDRPKRDIELIWASSDEEHHAADEDDDDEDEDIVTRKGKAKAAAIKEVRPGTGLRPVRAMRFDSDQQISGHTSTKRPQRRTKSTRMAQHDHDVIDEEGNEMEIDEQQISTEHNNVKEDMPSGPELARRRNTKKSAIRGKDSRSAVETVEERAERLRVDEDMRKMKEQFMGLPKLSKGERKEGHMHSDSPSDDQERKILLFQFPPLVPLLVDPEAESAQKSPSMAVKSDPDAPSGSKESAEGHPTNIQPPQGAQAEGFMTATGPTRLPAGRVGKLRIHKSGKVSLDWAGTDMELRYGTEVDFLQDAVLVNAPQQPNLDDDLPEQNRSEQGTAYALGQVNAKLVAIPDWQKLYD